mgnify:CR=1 FL=1
MISADWKLKGKENFNAMHQLTVKNRSDSISLTRDAVHNRM